MGRPREHDRIAIGKSFIEWVKSHPDCLTVPHFTTAKGYDTEMLIKWKREDADFRQYYNEAKNLIGLNRLNATINQTIDKQIYLMHIRNFDSDQKEDWKEEKQFESDLRKKENDQSNIPPDYVEAFNKHMNQIMNAQSSACKIVDNNNSADAKS